MTDADRDLLEARLSALLTLIGATVRPCKRCGVLIALVEHASGKTAPYNVRGDDLLTNHFLTCPHAAEFRRRPPPPAQQTLLDTSRPQKPDDYGPD